MINSKAAFVCSQVIMPVPLQNACVSEPEEDTLKYPFGVSEMEGAQLMDATHPKKAQTSFDCHTEFVISFRRDLHTPADEC